MKLCIINGWEEEHFKAVSEKGLHAVEFCANDNYDSAEILAKAEKIKSYSEKYDVAVASIGRWGMDRIDESGSIKPEAMQHDKNLVELASIVGCPVFNCGVNYAESFSFDENCEFAIKYLSELIAYGKERNVKIAVYNCDWSNFIYNERAWAVILHALPDLGIKYDASHCIHRNGDYLKEMRDWAKRFYHFHVKGVLYIEGKEYDDPPAGLDQINWGAVMTLLYDNDYNGALSIEPHSGYWKGGKGQWGVDFTIKYMSQFLMPDEYLNMQTNPYMP